MTPVFVVHRDQQVVSLVRRVLDPKEFAVVAQPWYEQKWREAVPVHGCYVVDMDDEACEWREIVAAVRLQGATRVILVTMRPVVEEIVAAITEGVAHVVDLRGGSLHLRSAILRAVGRTGAATKLPHEEPVRLDLLTEREREVLALMAKGLASKTIAHQLHISKRTVDMHRYRMLHKVNARSSMDLVRAFLGVSDT